MIWIFVLSSCMFILAIIIYIRTRISNKKIERLIEDRTSELKKQSQTHAIQSAMLTTLLNAIPDLIFVKDLNLRFTHLNEAFLKHFGRSYEDVIGKNDVEGLNIPVELAERFNERDRLIINSGKIAVEEEIVPDAGGTNLYFETHKVPVVMENTVIGIMGVARDITKRKELEFELATNYEYAKELGDVLAKITTTPAISIGDLETSAEVVTKEGCLALGASAVGVWLFSETRGVLVNITTYRATIDDFINEEDYDFSFYPQHAEQLISERDIIFNTIPRDSKIYNVSNPDLCALLEIPIHIEGEFFGIINIDQEFTEKYQQERVWTLEEQTFAHSLGDMITLAITGAERRKARLAADAASKSKSVFLANMSHEIRTPMNSIIGFSELAMDNQIPPVVKEYLSKILQNSKWLLQIINDILDISKLESGSMELENIPFYMPELFESCRTVILPQAIEKGLILHFYAEPSTGKVLLGDPLRLRQALVNLLSNAVKFTNSGIIKLFSEITTRTEDTVSMRFVVKDSGIGMSPAQIKKAFSPFLQAEAGTTRKYGGTGLGLAITKEIVEAMGGTLNVESTPEVGSKFSFEIVFDTMDDTEKENFEEKIILNEVKRPTFEGDVLLCEDNVMNQQVICEHLARVGLKIFIAENGKSGVEMVQKRKDEGRKQFDLILMDIHMPVMDGLEAAERILAMNPEIPIIAMTANVMDQDRKLYKKKGMNDYVGKPFTSQELWRCLMKYLKPVHWQREE